MGFLGGIAFACLVLVMQSSTTFDVKVGPLDANRYFSLLLGFLSLEVIASVVGSMIAASIASGWATENRKAFTNVTFWVAGSFILVTLPLLLMRFEVSLAEYIAAVEAALVALLVILEVLERKGVIRDNVEDY